MSKTSPSLLSVRAFPLLALLVAGCPKTESTELGELLAGAGGDSFDATALASDATGGSSGLGQGDSGGSGGSGSGGVVIQGNTGGASGLGTGGTREPLTLIKPDAGDSTTGGVSGTGVGGGAMSVGGAGGMVAGGSGGSTGRSCGGFIGTVCPKGQDCDLASNCGKISDSKGVCFTPGLVCPDFYVPVCGCDGKTYPSDCARLNAGVLKASEGACGGSVDAGITVVEAGGNLFHNYPLAHGREGKMSLQGGHGPLGISTSYS